MKKRVKSNRKLKVWLIGIIVAVVIAAVFVRTFLVYKVYPLEYKNVITQMSGQYGLDPHLVSSVIYTESRFKPDAVSNKGAVGLMQIMPETAEWIASKMKLDGFQTEQLFEPETNIRFGCWYLNYLFDTFHKDIDKVIAAYNAGPRKVKEWAADGALLHIPFPETENYLKNVKRNLYIYEGLYDDF